MQLFPYHRSIRHFYSNMYANKLETRGLDCEGEGDRVAGYKGN